MSREIYCALVVRKLYYTFKVSSESPLPLPAASKRNEAVEISWEPEDVLGEFSLLLFSLINWLGVNMLVKGSLLIRVLNELTSPNPIQWTFYAANTVCPPSA